MTISAPSKYTMISGTGTTTQYPALVYTDANGSIATVTNPWYLNASGILIPAPVDANGVPQMSMTGSSPTDAQATYQPGMEFNGETYDRKYGNTEGTLLISAARTATANTANQTNYNGDTVTLWLNVTVLNSTGISLNVYGVDPLTGLGSLMNSTAPAITATGLYLFQIGPSTSGGGFKQATSAKVPRTWFAQVYQGDALSNTYSLGQATN